MKAIITGMKGTLAPYIYDYFNEQNVDLLIWERQHIPIDNAEAIYEFIETSNADYFLHIATGPVEWLESIIGCLIDFSIPLVYISSEAVFNGLEGPFTTQDTPRAKDDYGHYKLTCERLVQKLYKENAYIFRLGWQIAHHTNKNNMLAYLVNEGHVIASSDWILSTSFMPDTAQAIYKIIKNQPPGLFHLDSNHNNMNFYELVLKLKDLFKLPITVEESHTYKHNNRLLSDQPYIRSLEDHLSELD